MENRQQVRAEGDQEKTAQESVYHPRMSGREPAQAQSIDKQPQQCQCID